MVLHTKNSIDMNNSLENNNFNDNYNYKVKIILITVITHINVSQYNKTKNILNKQFIMVIISIINQQ